MTQQQTHQKSPQPKDDPPVVPSLTEACNNAQRLQNAYKDALLAEQEQEANIAMIQSSLDTAKATLADLRSTVDRAAGLMNDALDELASVAEANKVEVAPPAKKK